MTNKNKFYFFNVYYIIMSNLYNEKFNNFNYYHYEQIIKEKNNDIEHLKKKLHNCQRTKLRLKNKLNFKIFMLEEKLQDYEIEDDWDEIKNEQNIEKKIKND